MTLMQDGSYRRLIHNLRDEAERQQTPHVPRVNLLVTFVLE